MSSFAVLGIAFRWEIDYLNWSDCIYFVKLATDKITILLAFFGFLTIFHKSASVFSTWHKTA